MENCELLGGRPFGNRYQKRLKQHVQFAVTNAKTETKKIKFDAVGFGLWEKFCQVKEDLQLEKKIDLIFIAELDPRSRSKASSKPQIRLNVLDIRVSS